jgi:hypothetical protein
MRAVVWFAPAGPHSLLVLVRSEREHEAEGTIDRL